MNDPLQPGPPDYAQSPPPLPLIGPAQEERLMALVAHLSIVIPHAGVLVPLALWLLNDKKAPFAAYQAKQAFFFQLAVIAAMWALLVGGFALGFLTFGIGWLALVPLLAALQLGAMIYGVVAGIRAYEGSDFRYWLIGDTVQP